MDHSVNQDIFPIRNGMKLTWFLNQVMLQASSRQEPPSKHRCAESASKRLQGPILKTRYGETILRKPQFREFPFGHRSLTVCPGGEGLVNAIVESYPGRLNEESQNRQSSGDRSALSGFGSGWQGSRRQVQAFRADRTGYPGPFVDASTTKSGRARSLGLVVAGVREDGYRESWRESPTVRRRILVGTLRGLKERGLAGVQLVISDGHLASRERLKPPSQCILADVQVLTRAVLRNIPGNTRKGCRRPESMEVNKASRSRR